MNDLQKDTNAFSPVLGREKIHDFVADHLNQVYCAKAHLVERLPELAEKANFKDLKHAILETCDDIENQIFRMHEIYTQLNLQPDLENCNDFVEFAESSFNPINQHSDDPGMRDLSILFYLSVMESIEQASFKILTMAAGSLPDKQIKQLLLENLDESKADRKLFLQLSERYMP